MSLTAKRPSRGEETKEKLIQNLTVDEGTARLNADIEKSLYRKIKIRCAEEDRSISDITRQLWIEYLSK
jgi:hypothetical protein